MKFNRLKQRQKQSMYGHDTFMPDGMSEDDFDQFLEKLHPSHKGPYGRRRKSPNQMTDIQNSPWTGGSNIDGTDADPEGTADGGPAEPDDQRWDGSGEEETRMDQEREGDGHFAYQGSAHMMDSPMSQGTALEDGLDSQEPNSPIGTAEETRRRGREPYLDNHANRLPGGGNFMAQPPLHRRLKKLQSAESPLVRAWAQIKKGCAL